MTGSKTSDWTPERRAKISAAVKARYERPGERERMSVIAKATRAREKAKGTRYEQPAEHRERMRQRCLAWNADPAMREVRREAAKKLWQSQAHREKMSRAFRIAAGFSVKSFRHLKKVNQLHKDRWANDPAYVEATMQRLKEARQRPGVREKIIAAVNTPKARAAAKRPRPQGFKIPPNREQEYIALMKKNRNNGWTSRDVGAHMGLLRHEMAAG